MKPRCSRSRARLACAAPAQAAELNLETLDGPTAVKMMDEGKLTSVELTRAYIARIAALNKRGPGLNAVTQLNPDALKDAALLDKERRDGPRARAGARAADPAQGPDRREGHVHVGGQLLAAQLVPGDRLRRGQEAARERRRDPRQARPVGVRELLRQPAVGLQQPHRPGAQRRRRRPEPVAAPRRAPARRAPPRCRCWSIGTETSGSIISPSQANGLVGLRPTVGLVPGYGIAPISASQDTAGPMDRTVANAALTLQSIAGYDAHNADYYSGIWGPGIDDTDILPPVPRTVPNYMSALDLNFVRGKRIGWNGTLPTAGQAGQGARWRRAGAIMVERPVISPAGVPAARSSTGRRTATSTTTTRTSGRTRRSSRWRRRSPTTRPTSTRR